MFRLASSQSIVRCGLLGCLLIASGCQNWPQAWRFKQNQIESDRLLSEFRAQKQRADELENRNRQLQEQLSESEKLLARLQSQENALAAIEPTSSDESSSPRSLAETYSEIYRRRMQAAAATPVSAPTPLSTAQPAAVPTSGDGSLNAWRPLPRRN